MMTLLDRIGLCSVTFRQLPVEDVVRVSADVGLRTIEWGADVHIPGVEEAARVRALTESDGMTVAALGSYYRVGDAPEGEFAGLLETALALGAPRIRVWAGSIGSAAANEQHRDRLVADAERIGRLATSSGVDVGFEFHGNTLTDTLESTLDLMSRLDGSGVGSYWQPPQNMADDEALAGLRAVLPYLMGVHVFSWWPGGERLPLDARGDLWRRVGDVLREAEKSVDLLIEFIPGDDPEGLAEQVQMMRELLG